MEANKPMGERAGETAARKGDAAHEMSDVSIPGIVKFGLGLAIATAAVYVLMWGLFHYFAGREERLEPPPSRMALGQGERLPPEPRLQGSPGHVTTPVEELKALREAGEEVLGSYGWVDRNAGVVRIPIDRAMMLILERGLPARPAPAGESAEAEAK